MRNGELDTGVMTRRAGVRADILDENVLQDIMGLTLLNVAMAPQHKLFQDKKQQNTEQHGTRHMRRIFRQLQRLR